MVTVECRGGHSFKLDDNTQIYAAAYNTHSVKCPHPHCKFFVYSIPSSWVKKRLKAGAKLIDEPDG